MNRIQRSFAISAGDEQIPLLPAVETLGEIATNATASEQSLLSKAYRLLLSLPASSSESRVTTASLSALIKLWFAVFSVSCHFVAFQFEADVYLLILVDCLALD
jgi:hypothetical protein